RRTRGRPARESRRHRARAARRPWGASRRSRPELRFFGRAREREGRALAERSEDRVEVARADLALVAGRRVPLPLERELAFLKLDVGRHAAVAVAVRQLEHRLVERVETGEGDELEPVAEVAELVLETRD